MVAEKESELLSNYFYHPENEGTAKTFRSVITDIWYYETELINILGVESVELIKNN